MEAIGAAQLGVFVVTLALAILSPGPAIVACARSAAARGMSVSLPYAAGLAFGASLWCLAALFGLVALFHWQPGLLRAMELVGGAYLLFIAFKMWRHAADPLDTAAAIGRGPGFWSGVALNLSNPKPALFYAAVILRLFPGLTGLAAPAVVYGVALTVEMTFYLSVTALMSTGPVRRRYFAAKPWIDRLSGALIGVLGLTLILSL